MLLEPTAAFVPVAANRTPFITAMSSSTASSPDFIVDPAARDATYRDNMAQYLLDLHAANATFDFCGGMLFQLELTPALREYLGKGANVVLHEANQRRMYQVQGYEKSSFADNVRYFHGRPTTTRPTRALTPTDGRYKK